jgi:hypothetical protein
MTSWRAVALAATAVVFALAIGIILGSGPLRTALTGQTAAQADDLRGQVADRDAQLLKRDQDLARTEELLRALVPVAVHGRLQGETVVLVVGASVPAESVATTKAALTAAGATVTVTVSLSPSWLSAEQGAFRSALAEQIIADVGVPDTTAPAEHVLSGALVQAVVPSAAAASAPSPDPDTEPLDAALAAQRAAVLSDVLTKADLVTFARAAAPPAEGDDLAPDVTPDPTLAVLLVGDQEDPAERALAAQQWVQLGATFAEAGLGVVLVTGAPRSGWCECRRRRVDHRRPARHSRRGTRADRGWSRLLRLR